VFPTRQHVVASYSSKLEQYNLFSKLSNVIYILQVLGEVKFEHPVQAIDTTMGGRLFAVGDGGRSLKMCSLK